jgi:flagellar motor switch protein FliM
MSDILSSKEIDALLKGVSGNNLNSYEPKSKKITDLKIFGKKFSDCQQATTILIDSCEPEASLQVLSLFLTQIEVEVLKLKKKYNIQ